MRAVMDTNVLIAALRSRRGASFELFRRLRLSPAVRQGVEVLKPVVFLTELMG
jgi:hypothetical protein